MSVVPTATPYDEAIQRVHSYLDYYIDRCNRLEDQSECHCKL